ncbi:MAG: nitroreductase family protein [Synergistaceae bacterium]|jgi:nitroreductase|nr:nitroreductase family protein [Synergistaceae bacterium]
MNETLLVIRNRRSVRNFRLEQIKDVELEEILEAGKYAPSAANQQSWHFTVVQNQVLLDRISQAVKMIYKELDEPFLRQLANDEKFHLYFHAPSVIVISGNQSAMFPDFDCSLAAENIMIAAESMDIGSCWVSGLPRLADSEIDMQILKDLDLPEGYKPLCAIALGYKEGTKAEAAVRKGNTVNYIR